MTTARSATPRLAEVRLPDFGMPETMPEIPAATYEARVEALLERADARGYDRLVVYADREHSANMAFLTGFDPRFEEALLILGPTGQPVILVGNECYGMAGAAPLPMRRELFQDLSLPSQPRDRSRPLADILEGEGIRPGGRVGVIGWKTYASRATIEVPAFVVDELRRSVGPSGTVENANDLLIDAADGLRVINDVDQLAAFEYASCQTSHGVRRLLVGLRPGLREYEAVRLLEWNGAPLSCHLMLTAGPRARLGLLSPARPPDRAGRSVHGGVRHLGRAHLPGRVRRRGRRGAARRDPRLRRAARRTVLRDGGRVVRGAPRRPDRRRAPGDRRSAPRRPVLRHLPQPGSPAPPRRVDQLADRTAIDDRAASGMVFQVDIIPATGTDYFTTNIEDGLALADASLRAAFAASYPDAWARIQARRRFMTDALGIDLHPDVLPFSNIPAFLPPFLLRPDRVMTLAV